MVRTGQLGWLGLVLIGGAIAQASADGDDGLFRDLPLDRAKQASLDEGKRFVLVAFTTAGSAPCSKLDETTWKDQGVRAWLAKEAVCIKLDGGEKNAAMVVRYRVNAYPTLVMLRPDGTEIERLVGYRDANIFLSDAADALAGLDHLSRARKALEGGNIHSPMLRMDYANTLAQLSRNEDALSEYLWCFDHGLEFDQSFTGVRVSFLLTAIVKLGQAYPAAIDALGQRRDVAARAIEAGTADFSTTMGFTALNRELNQPEQTLSVYDRVKATKKLNPNVLSYLRDQSTNLLLVAKRYKDIVDGIDPLAKVRLIVTQHNRQKAFTPNDPRLRAMFQRQVIVEGAKYYEASLGVGNQAVAAEVAAVLIKFDPVGSFPELIAAARRVGDDKTAEALTEQAAKDTPKP